ncbi:MAG: hypothetical protein EZS28_002916, partial [Streblomastix strix]
MAFPNAFAQTDEVQELQSLGLQAIQRLGQNS